MTPLIKEDNSQNQNLPYNNPLTNSSFFEKEKVIIPSKSKNSLLKELHILGINRGSVLLDINSKIESIIQESEWEIERINNLNF